MPNYMAFFQRFFRTSRGLEKSLKVVRDVAIRQVPPEGVTEPERRAQQTLGSSPRAHSYACLDGLRGLAALGVVLAHVEAFFGAWVSPSGHYDRSVATWQIYNALFHGQFCVCIFFVLSGFVLLVKYDKTHNVTLLREGAIKRYVRLTPVVLFSTLLSWLAYKLIGFHNVPAADLLGGHAWLREMYDFNLTLGTAVYQGLWGAYRGDYSYNGVLWTISIELWGSILLFGFVALFYRSSAYEALVLVAVLALVSLGGDTGVYYSLFLGGSLLLKTKARVPLALLPIVVFFGIQNPHTPFVKWCGAVLTSRHVALGATPSVLFSAAAALILVPMVVSDKRLSTFLSTRPLVWLGNISFSLYAVHALLIPSVGSWIVVHGHESMSPRTLGFCAFVGVIGTALLLATAVTRVLEMPSREWANRFGAAWTRNTVANG